MLTFFLLFFRGNSAEKNRGILTLRVILLSDVAFFDEALTRYHKQHGMAEAIKEKRPIGMLLIDAVKMKGLMIPSPLRCLDVSNDIITIYR